MTLVENEKLEIAPDIAADIAKFRDVLEGFKKGEIEEDVFRVFRLTNGIYGQRQGEENQMVRVRVPYGQLSPAQLRMFARVVDEYSRGWGHITTRQNLQMHFVQLPKIPEVLELLGSVGLSSREACGDTVRNVQGCHLAGACPFEVIDISAWAKATDEHLLRNSIAQRLPRKFKINFSGCDTDCGQAMFNDAGVIAVNRKLDDGTYEQGFRVYVAGGLGANPHPALAFEEFTSKEELLPTIEAIVRVFEQTGNRANKLRARMKWVVDELGWEETQQRILKSRHLLLASSSWPGGIPEAVKQLGDAPAGTNPQITPTPVGQGVAVKLTGSSPYDRWEQANVVRGVANGTVSAYAWCRLGDVTSQQMRGLADIIEEFSLDARVSNRQNFILRDLKESDLPALFDRLVQLDMAQPGAELSRDVVSCPGADTCGLAITQSRGLAKAIGERLETEGLADVGGVRFNISGCTNSCGQHHTADIGFFGIERRSNKTAVPGYQMMIGGYVGEEKIHFGQKTIRVAAKYAPDAAVHVLRRFVDEKQAGESFRGWMDRSGGAKEIAVGLKEFSTIPTIEESPEFYVDFDETTPFKVEVGESECAT